jgi:DNA-binding CsgD family transcriptional regulator
MASRNLLEPVGDMVALLGSRAFGSGFFHIVNDMIGIDHCTVFISRGDGPRTLVAEAQSEPTADRVRSLAKSYVRSGYHSDPVWETCKSRRNCEAFILSPPELADDRYRQEFYIKPNIKHELALTTAIADDRIYAGFYRENGKEDFSADSVDIMRQCGRAIMQVLQKQGELSQEMEPPRAQPISQKALLDRVRTAIVADNNSLTAREAEICASIVLGYTVLGISLNLGISINTVATHRKRAYAKLRVSSQNELFARYFSIVENNIHHMHQS